MKRLRGSADDTARRQAAQDALARVLANERISRGDLELTDDETAALVHASRWGSDGYPVSKVGERWTYSFLGLEAGRVFKTKHEAEAAWEVRLAVLRIVKGEAARRRELGAVRS